MGLETGTWVDDLVTTNPDGTADPKSQGDDHLRLIKSVLKSTFPNATRAFRFETVTTKAGAYTVLATDQRALILGDATAGAFTITLPLGSNVFAGFSVIVEKSDSSANAVTVDGNGAETIDGAATRVLDTQFEAVKFMWDGAEWKALAATIVGTAGIKNGAVTTAKVADDAVTYAKMQNVSAASRLLGRITAGAGDPEELTGTQATTLLDAFTSALKGLAPASGGGTTNFLRADGTWASPGAGDTLGTDRTLPAAGTDSFTGLPSGLNEIVVMLADVSLGTTELFGIKIGDSGGIETTGYRGQAGEIGGTSVASTAFFLLVSASANADLWTGIITLSRKTGNQWTYKGVLESSAIGVAVSTGKKTLSGELTQVQLAVDGAGNFDGGSWNIRYH